MKDIIYGINPVLGALKNNAKFHTVYIDKNKFENEINLFQEKGIQVKSFSNLDLDKYPWLKEKNLQSIAAEVEPPQMLSVKEIIIKAKKETETPVIVLSDKITDPQNLGTIIRNISAFNAQGLIIPSHNQVPITAAVHKTSVGNTYSVSLARTKSLQNAILELKEAGFWIVETRMDGKMNLQQLSEYGEPLVIVLGNESKGISEAVSKRSDLSLNIEMTGQAESLNVAVASGIILHKLQKT